MEDIPHGPNNIYWAGEHIKISYLGLTSQDN